jgi:hypothetical protein
MSETSIIAKPQANPGSLSLPYWQAARKGRLMVQQCAECLRLRHYPTLLCPSCHSLKVNWVELTGLGRIHSWTITHHSFHPAFNDQLPLALVTVDMDEGVRTLGRWLGSQLTIGHRVKARFAIDGDRADLEFIPFE